MKSILTVTFIIGVIFGLIASFMAFLISYEEYSRHYTEKKKPFRLAMGTAVFTFFVFLMLSIISGIFLNRMF